MKEKNNLPLVCILVNEQYKFYYSDGGDPLKDKKVIRPKLPVSDKSVQTYFIFGDFAFEGIYLDYQNNLCYEIPFCKHCGSLDVIRKDFNTRNVFNSVGGLETIRLKRYQCKNCGRKSQTELFDVYEPYDRIPAYIKKAVGLALRNGHKTLRQHSKDIKLYTGISISHESVRKALFSGLDELYKKWDFKYSGYYGYDAQWIPDSGKFAYRLSLIDIVKYLPVAEAVVKNEDEDTIYDFINKSIPTGIRKGIITDSKPGYDKVMVRLNFNHHQHCTFHLLQRINDKINTEVNKFKRKFKKELKEKDPEISDEKLKEEADEAAKEYRKQFEPYHDKVKEIFEHDNYDDAVDAVEKLKKEMDTFPKFLSKYLNKNFFPKYKGYIEFLKSTAKHLEKTNNKCENYIGKIIDKYRKGDFKTLDGFFDYILHRIDGWIDTHMVI